ncbi:DUF1192 domain-containing protein [Croceicoccus sp. F390]|uniref:DUF1192 domain-containing protein n=1 Tax=Croceicoccus esteveae TaxID=3075597 RepID=A0ABU2ZIQ5_9SPHN|nr:DUF1192 domain-containing protein [Croceicoccus sp. F390]MDT0576096.1 DUF1192 domain-containing protein [Croceicoccus sp. F390]
MTQEGEAVRPGGDLVERLAAEDLGHLSQAELAARIDLLELEIARTRTHMAKVADHRRAAELLFRSPV